MERPTNDQLTISRVRDAEIDNRAAAPGLRTWGGFRGAPAPGERGPAVHQKFIFTPNFTVRGFSTDVAFSHAAPNRVVIAVTGFELNRL